MSLFAWLKGKGPNGFGYGSTADEVTQGLELSRSTILLTGCAVGLGRETLKALALRGAHVIAAGRTRERAQQGCQGFESTTTPIACDLSDLASVRASVDELQRDGRPIDAIICNAGIMALPKLKQVNGCELQFYTNHVGHFALVTGLLQQLNTNGRVVMVSSSAHKAAPAGGIQFDNLSGEREYDPWKAYGQSKLANLLFARALARRLEGSDRTANALHPGVIKTKLARHMGGLVDVALAIASPIALKSAAQGAATQCYVAVHPDVIDISGRYFVDCHQAISSELGADMTLAEALWDKSEEIVSQA